MRPLFLTLRPSCPPITFTSTSNLLRGNSCPSAPTLSFLWNHENNHEQLPSLPASKLVIHSDDISMSLRWMAPVLLSLDTTGSPTTIR